MYNDFLSELQLDINNIYLDPNNPRFWSEKTTRSTPDRRIIDSGVQTRTRADIEKHGIDELSDSILRNGFLPMDRVVVRAISGHDGKFVVVEGNRRIAALKALRERIDNDAIDEDHVDEEYLQRLLEDTAEIQVLVYNGDDTNDIAWLLQGIRHISGIRDWSPAQRARLVATQIDTENLGFREAGQKFGLTPQAVGRYYRPYKALDQMRTDD